MYNSKIRLCCIPFMYRNIRSVCVHACTVCVRVHVRVCLCVSVRLCVYVCVHVCVWVWEGWGLK